MPWISLCHLDELKEGEGRYVEIGGFRLAVFLHQGKVYVIDDECPHAGGSLAGGDVEDGCAVCPWHGWSFHLDSGELRHGGGVRISTYRARLLEREGQLTLVQAELPMP